MLRCRLAWPLPGGETDDGSAVGRPDAGCDIGTSGQLCYCVPGRDHDAERRRLDLQAETHGRLSAWTLDALGLGVGQRVVDLGCGSGALLPQMAHRVGPSGRVIGVDRDARLLAAAREQVALYPWVELIDADALKYATDEPFDAVHCRIVLIHQPTPQEFVAHMVALTRPGGRVAVQDVDADGPTGAPTVLCHPPFAALERLGTAYLTASLRRGSDSQAGRKVLDRFRQAGLAELRTEAQAAFVPLTDPRAATMLDVFARGGAAEDAERFGVMAAAEYTSVLAEVQRARHDRVYDACLVRLWTVVATVGSKPTG
jgi:ubiquinone/menaquinone biosynthesis C-methylase UbiE